MSNEIAAYGTGCGSPANEQRRKKRNNTEDTENTEEKEKIINEQRATRTAESILQRSLTTLLAMSD